MDYGYIPTTRKTGAEDFNLAGSSIGYQLSDFWSWAYSELSENIIRGKLAEFIVATALGVAKEPLI